MKLNTVFKTECIGTTMEKFGCYCGCNTCSPKPVITDEQREKAKVAAEEREAQYLLEEELKNNHVLAVGDLFTTSWGYDQTNYDFIIVKSISKTGKTAQCQRAIESIHNDTNEQAPYCDKIIPKSKGFGDIFTMQIKKNYYGTGVCLRGTYAGSRGDKGFRLGSFSWCLPKKAYYPTNSQFGH